MNGFVCIDKPAGPTSFGVVAAVRKACGVKKAGHAGTLDPAATGLLIVGLGFAPRLFPYLALEPKVYRFSMQFGRTTDTLDSEGTFSDERGMIPERERVDAAVRECIGEISQVPPRYSAVKIKGVPAYRLARKQIPVEMKPRRVRISQMHVESYNDTTGIAGLVVTCSTGTYVRSLARDIARMCGTIAYTTAIRRVAVGRWSVDQACPLDRLGEERGNAVISLSRMLDSAPRHQGTPEQLSAIGHGREITIESGSPHIFVFDMQDRLVAVTHRTGENRYHPKRVFGAS